MSVLPTVMVASGSTVLALVAWLLVRRVRRSHQATDAGPVRRDASQCEPAVRVVATGHDTPYSLARAAGMPSCRDRIVDLNRGRSAPSGAVWHGGVFPRGMEVLLPDELELPSLAPPPARSPVAMGFGAAVLLSAGALAVLERRRAHRLRAASAGAESRPPEPMLVRAETLLRGLDAGTRLARLERAVRSAAVALADQGAAVAAVLMGDDGDLRLFLRGAARPAGGPWRSDGTTDVWTLDAHVPTAALVADHQPNSWPSPALAHLGALEEGGFCFVDLEVLGVLLLETPFAASVLRHLAVSIEVSPFAGAATVVTTGVADASALGANDDVPSLDAALTAASLAVGTTTELARRAGTFALRVAGAGGDTWDPAIVIGAGPVGDVTARALSTRAAPGCGLAVVVEGCASPETPWSLRWDGDAHVLEPLALRIMPCALEGGDVRVLRDLLAAESTPLAARGVSDARRRPSDHATYVEPPWALLVRTYGRVEVVATHGATADFERSKSLELVAWLSTHRRGSTRGRSRAALWDNEVRATTFSNVVSDARRALARTVAPPAGQEWIGRTLSDDLPLHPLVVSDAFLLEHRVRHARGLDPLDAIEVLRAGLELVDGMPFANTGYLWPDAEGISSRHVVVALGASVQLAEHYLTVGDFDGVFWATGQGLKVLAGHEELIALRMRAYARRGDLAGVRSEWERYERAIAADPWEAAEPSPKLLLLRRELLGDRSRAG